MKELMVTTKNAVIDSNFEEVRESLLEGLKKYEGIVVTDDNLKDCKATQKDLAKVRKGIDEYRKIVKKEINKPLVEFEGKCKELIGLVTDVENPIKSNINIFDEKRKMEKVQVAKEEIQKAVAVNSLRPEYADRLTMLSKYSLLTASRKSVTEDIQARAIAIKEQQDADDLYKKTCMETIDATVEMVNKNISLKLEAKSFYDYIESGYNSNQIIKAINDKAEYIRKAEEKKEEEVKKAQEKAAEKAQELKQGFEPIRDVPPIPGPQVQVESEPKYFVKLYVEHNFEMIQELSKFLRTRGYDVKVAGKGKVENDN